MRFSCCDGHQLGILITMMVIFKTLVFLIFCCVMAVLVKLLVILGLALVMYWIQ